MFFATTTISGAGLGRTINYPTINLKIPNRFTLRQGVYSCYVKIGEQKYLSILYFGKKTVGKQGASVDNQWKTLEVHILKPKYKPSKYSKISVKTLYFIRPPKIFKTKFDLKKQIFKDIQKLTSLHVDKVV